MTMDLRNWILICKVNSVHARRKKKKFSSLLLEYKYLSIFSSARFLFPWVLTLLQSYYSALEQTFSTTRVGKHSDVNSCFETEEKNLAGFCGM